MSPIQLLLANHDWLVVSTHLKNISQLGWLFPIYGKMFQTTHQMISNELFTICYTEKGDFTSKNNGLSFFGQSAQVQLPGSPPCSPSMFGENIGRQHNFINLPHHWIAIRLVHTYNDLSWTNSPWGYNPPGHFQTSVKVGLPGWRANTFLSSRSETKIIPASVTNRFDRKAGSSARIRPTTIGSNESAGSMPIMRFSFRLLYPPDRSPLPL